MSAEKELKQVGKSALRVALMVSDILKALEACAEVTIEDSQHRNKIEFIKAQRRIESVLGSLEPLRDSVVCACIIENNGMGWLGDEESDSL